MFVSELANAASTVPVKGPPLSHLKPNVNRSVSVIREFVSVEIRKLGSSLSFSKLPILPASAVAIVPKSTPPNSPIFDSPK